MPHRIARLPKSRLLASYAALVAGAATAAIGLFISYAAAIDYGWVLRLWAIYYRPGGCRGAR